MPNLLQCPCWSLRHVELQGALPLCWACAGGWLRAGQSCDRAASASCRAAGVVCIANAVWWWPVSAYLNTWTSSVADISKNFRTIWPCGFCLISQIQFLACLATVATLLALLQLASSKVLYVCVPELLLYLSLHVNISPTPSWVHCQEAAVIATWILVSSIWKCNLKKYINISR